MRWIAQLLFEDYFLSVDFFQREGLMFPKTGVTDKGQIMPRHGQGPLKAAELGSLTLAKDPAP